MKLYEVTDSGVEFTSHFTSRSAALACAKEWGGGACVDLIDIGKIDRAKIIRILDGEGYVIDRRHIYTQPDEPEKESPA